jgi:4-hydroxy-tetrahydrodipicolinate reductase
MNIALIGYGKMGHEIEKAAIGRGHNISLIIDIDNPQDMTTGNLGKTDVAIEFTSPSSVTGNLKKCFEAGLPVVTGTTGWYEELEQVLKLCGNLDGTLFYASNFSLGVNILFAVNEYLAGVMDHFEQYDVSIEETHHTQKLDAPSGTAISLAGQILASLGRKVKWKLGESGDAGEIPIKANREGDVKGIHEIKYFSDVDILSLKHEALSRKGFALGAVMAAEYVPGKKGVFTMSDLLGI